ncbi:MAG: hypothetical protein RLN89_06260, partial [Parvibaculum sp.]
MNEAPSFEKLLEPTSLVDQNAIPSFLLTFREPIQQALTAVGRTEKFGGALLEGLEPATLDDDAFDHLMRAIDNSPDV